jgi:phosphatidylserine/phosphatidylglycerophosphate/cardiolipin synthase-like enzyme
VATYAEIITEKPVQRFLLKFYLAQYPVKNLVLVSPFMGALKNTRVTLEGLCLKIKEKNIPTYVITRKPEYEDHQQAVDMLKDCDLVELRYNESLHAKLYICSFYDDTLSFALLGSGNLTRHSIEKNIEIAMMIYGREDGREIIRELSKWGLERMRTLSELAKRIKYVRR